jgi:hypothetical protein
VPPIRLPALLLLALAACASPPEGPRLLTGAEIAAATQGSTARPDTAPLQARASGLSARAEALRRAVPPGVSDAERLRQLRAAQLPAT